jgi:methanogenic corrinoid protein MtbC1
MNGPSFNIAAVERDTGLSKDVLRMWERRYGFPVPERDANGERAYPADQVERLRQIKHLIDRGHRPGKLLSLPADDLARLAPRRVRETSSGSATIDGQGLEDMLALIRRHDASGYGHAMQQHLARHGLQRFVTDVVAPLTRRVGEAWEDGRIEVFEEHLFTELTKRVLRQAIAALPPGTGGPRVLLTSVPDEQHGLGLLMLEALFALERAECISLGLQTPLVDIGRAAVAHRVDIVTLSFSAAFPARQVVPVLQQLRQLLPATVDLWVGGAGMARASAPAGIRHFQTLEQGLDALAEWRATS